MPDPVTNNVESHVYNNVALPLTRSQITRHLSLNLAVQLEEAMVRAGQEVDSDEVMYLTRVFHNWIAKGDMPAEVEEVGAVT